MLTFKQYLNEVLNNPYEWKLVKTSIKNIEYKFTTELGITYDVGLIRSGDGESLTGESLTSSDWDLRFNIEEDSLKKLGKDDRSMYKLSGTGDQFRVFATVQDILKDFIIKQTPDLISFSASSIGEPSRRRLYSLFTANFKKSQPELFKTYIAWSTRNGADNFIMKREFAKKVLTLTPPTSYLYKIIPADYRDELR
jgi:hypothetical protein